MKTRLGAIPVLRQDIADDGFRLAIGWRGIDQRAAARHQGAHHRGRPGAILRAGADVEHSDGADTHHGQRLAMALGNGAGQKRRLAEGDSWRHQSGAKSPPVTSRREREKEFSMGILLGAKFAPFPRLILARLKHDTGRNQPCPVGRRSTRISTSPASKCGPVVWCWKAERRAGKRKRHAGLQLPAPAGSSRSLSIPAAAWSAKPACHE